MLELSTCSSGVSPVTAPVNPSSATPPAAVPTAATRAMIERLVAFDTTSRNSNLDLIHDVRDYLADLGVPSQLCFDDERRKANLYATLGPTDRRGIALSGHTDVVPVDGQDWSSDPWTLREADGRLYGRGTCDMKSFIAVALACAPRFLEIEPKTPVHLCLSYDEEIGCVGVRTLLDYLRRQEVIPRVCIVGEPTEMQVVTAHKGKLSCACQVRGFECHSSLAPTGVNAVQAAARVVAHLDTMARRKAADGPFDADYDVPHTTVHTGLIQGGTALNIVPKDCRFEFEFRHLPDEDPTELLREVTDFARQELEPEMQALHPETGFSWQELSHIPALATPEDDEVVTLVKGLAQANSTTKVAFGTEAGRFQELDIATVVCGPGSIEQAHKPNEFVTLEQVAACEAFMDRLIARLSANDEPLS